MDEKVIVRTVGVPTSLALRLAAKVIEEGKISRSTVKGEEIDHYCWHTKFQMGYHVMATPNSPTSTTFQVWREKDA